MNYSEYLKQKIINLYSINQRIGKHSITYNDFEFLNKYFDVKKNIKPNIYSVSETLQHIIVDYKNNFLKKNKIGFDFIEILFRARENADIFLQNTPLQEAQIRLEQKQDLEEKYTKLANKYGLKEFYYTLQSSLTPEENYNKAILLLNKTEIELSKLQEKLDIKDPYKIGNGILSIQVNWQAEPQNNGYYNYCSNTICLKDENSTFPLIHEYIHFIDKTTTCILLTGKTSQQLYEEKIFTQKDLFNNFDMSVFSKIQFNKENFPWIDILKLKYLFKEELKQNKYMQDVFNKFDKKKDYREEFKDIIFSWIEKQNYPNEKRLIKEIELLLNSKATTLTINDSVFTEEEINILSKCGIFNTFELNINNSKNWSEELDFRTGRLYYSTQKEMLARTIERAIQGNLEQLSDRLTTPILSYDEQVSFFEIIKAWQNISLEIIDIQNKHNVSSRISKIREKLEKNPEIISHFKLNS